MAPLPPNTIHPEGAYSWQEIEAKSAALEAVPTPQVRLEVSGDTVRLRGKATVAEHKTVKAGDKLFQLPAGLAPTQEGLFLLAITEGAGVANLRIKANGEVEYDGSEQGENEHFYFDGITWSIV